MRYGYKKSARFCVASTGRCGSTLMTQFLIDNIGEDKVFGVHARDFVEFNGKVIFLFGNPLDTVISTHTRVPDLAPHYANMNGNIDRYPFWITEDTLGIEAIFDDWYRPHPWDMLSIRYETMWDNLDPISEFTGIDFTRFPVKKIRNTDWKDFSRNKILQRTYKRISTKIMSAKDIKLWTRQTNT